MFKHNRSLAGTFTSISGGILAMTIGTGVPINTAQANEAREPDTCYDIDEKDEYGRVEEFGDDLQEALDENNQHFILEAQEDFGDIGDENHTTRFYGITSAPDGNSAHLYIQQGPDRICQHKEGRITYSNYDKSAVGVGPSGEFGTKVVEGLGDTQSPCNPMPDHFRRSGKDNETVCSDLETYIENVKDHNGAMDLSLQMVYDNEKMLTVLYNMGLSPEWGMAYTSPNGSTQSVLSNPTNNGWTEFDPKHLSPD